MKRLKYVLLLFPFAAHAQMPADYRSPGAPPPQGVPIRKHAIDDPGPGATNFGLAPLHDNAFFMMFSADRLEYRWFDGGEAFLWDVQAWAGRDYNKLYLESEGEWSEEEASVEASQIELLYARAVSPFWDTRAGVRIDPDPNPSRSFAVVGMQGLAPQWFETELNAYLSEDGDFSLGLEAEYDFLITQRLVLQPRMETEFAAQDVPEYGIGAGFTDIELGARLRYEFSRKFAPYVGVSWEAALGETANIVEDGGGDAETLAVVAGVRCWL